MVFRHYTPIRNVYDFRTVVLRRLFDLYAASDERPSSRAWRIERGRLATLIGVSAGSLQTYLDRAEITEWLIRSKTGPGQASDFVLDRSTIAVNQHQRLSQQMVETAQS